MNKLFVFTLLMLLCGSVLFAQIYSSFAFSASTGTYTEITGTTIPVIQVDDEISGEIPIGFTFLYATVPYTSVKISSNGWIGMGTAATFNNNQNALNAETSFPIVAPLWDDISLALGTCQYLTSGTAPSRIFTVQYQNARWDYDTDNQFNFQVKFYESGKIEFIYGTSVGDPSEASASIGLNILPGGANNFYSVTPGNPATASYLAENASVGTFPGNGVKYTFDMVVPVPNDLSALSLIGNQTPSVGTASNYTVQIRNMGTASQSNYTVKIMSGANILASVAGPLITAGTTVNIQVPWTPQTAGGAVIYAKVVLAGDAYPQNDNTNSMNVMVQAAGTTLVTIGVGDESAPIPIDFYWKNSLFETIYPAEEVAMGGLITGLSFYNNFVTNLPQKPTKIWLGLTQQSDLSTGWIPSTDLTLVFDGNVDYPSGQNTIIIPLTTPYIYAGGNLVMMFQRPTDSEYFSFDDVFYSQTVGTNRSRLIYNDVNPYDPANPPIDATVSGQYPKTSLYFVAPSPNPQFSVSPASKNFGTLLMNTTASQIFTVLNIGGGSLTVSSINIAGSPFFTLQNMPTLPVTLNSLQSTTFRAQYLPTAAGTHVATVTLTDNLTRTQHTVQLSAVCMDPTIYTSPYVQNFDGVTTPNLPLDWQKLYVPFVSWGELGTINGNAHSAPNCVNMYNSSSTASDLMLISPPLGQALIVPAIRTKFWAKSSSSGTLQVGIIADVADPATFTSISTVTLTNSWVEYIVSFQTYTGAGRHIVFKHGNSSMWENVYIDDVTIENTPQNDLAALSISGNSTPSVSAATNFNVTLFNWGTNPQTNYTVKLYNPSNLEIASVAGPAIQPGLQATAVISWTPLTAGSMYVYAKVVLASDQNNLNDQTPNMNLLVQAAGTTAITIGAGDELASIPVNMYWHNSLFETIYDATDIPAGGLITGLAFYNNFVTNLPQKPTKIWLGNTDLMDLSTGWIPSTALTLVFDGLVDYPSGTNTITVPLTSPYPYAGTNLVMMVNRPMDTVFYSFNDQFLSQTVGTNRSLTVYSDGDVFDPENPPVGWANPSGIFPKTTIFFAPSGPNPQFGVAPASKNFGSVLLNATKLQTFTVFNYGGAALTVNSIGITGSPMYTLQNLPVLPLVLNPGQNSTFVAQYHPTAAGTHEAVITIGDNQGRSFSISAGKAAKAAAFSTGKTTRPEASRTNHTVLLTAVCVDPTIYTSPYLQNFDSVSIPALPIDWQKIYQATPHNGYIYSATDTPHSQPNCINMYDSDSGSGDMILVAPPMANTLTVTGMRTRFWARSGGYPLEVGIIADPTDPATFTSISTITPSNEWAEYIVSFQTYTGGGHYIAFRHAMAGMYQSIYIDDVMIENTPQNDLAALTISGNTTPSVGLTTNYTVNVFNWGTNPQSNYTVKLYNAANVEIASVAGPLCGPGLAVPVVLTWSPTVVETTYIYGKVILTGDQNNLNNQTPNLNLNVQPAGTMVVTIGDGSQQARMPVDMVYHNSLFETIYLSSEMGFIGQINGVSFYNNFVSDLSNMPTNIWLGTTTQSDLSNGWIPSTNMTQVFAGTVNYPSGQNVIIIEFPQPFLYLEGNLVMMVQRPFEDQFHNWQDNFFCQTIGSNRALNVYDDQATLNPAVPPTDGYTTTGQFPKTSFFVIPGGVGHLTGNVYGAGNVLLNNTTVHILGGAQVTTDAQGHYLIQNILAGTYQVTVSRYGYIAQTVSVEIPEDITVTQNFTLTQMPTVTLTGRIVGSDAPTIGLPGATFSMTGYENYTVTTNALGQFTVPGVYTNQTYNYTSSFAGYQNYLGTVVIGTTNYVINDIVLSEIAYTPRNVAATTAENNTIVNVVWQAPDPNAIDITQGFEDVTFPPTDWSRIVTNNGPANGSGVYPTWCRFGVVTDGTTTVTPPEGNWQCGFWWTFNHQDEWLITPQFNCPQGASLSFETRAFYGSQNNDHYYVKISDDNGLTWDILWDATALTGGWNNYQTPVNIGLDAYTGQQVKIAWHADDPNSTQDGMWYNWFIDNIVIGNNIETIRFPESVLTTRTAAQKAQKEVKTPVKHEIKPLVAITNVPSTRATDNLSLSYRTERNLPNANHKTRNHGRPLIGYKVWRLAQGQEQNEATWTLLTPENITVTNLVDNGWAALLTGTFKWAIKGVYTNGVLSLAAFSNAITVPTGPQGTLVGTVRNAGNIPIAGAVITAGPYSATTAINGAYNLNLPVGTYTVVCTATGYQPQTHTNVTINQGQNTTSNFTMPVGNEDVVNIDVTTLKGNYPNPFNPVTTISFDVKTKAPVRIDIYNTKGQLIRTLVNEVKSGGRYDAIWNGKDNNGNGVASGIYYYRMQAGSYQSTRRMMLMK